MTHKFKDPSKLIMGERSSLDARLAAYAAVSLSMIATGAAQATDRKSVV